MGKQAYGISLQLAIIFIAHVRRPGGRMFSKHAAQFTALVRSEQQQVVFTPVENFFQFKGTVA
jgi:hypothetical protein